MMETENPKRDRPSDNVVKEYLCTFQNGAKRHLLAEVRSQEEIFIITMQPPALRDIIKITFFSDGRAVSREVEALVTEISYRPTEVRLCGFVAVITNQESLFTYPPPFSLQSVDVSLVTTTRQERIEKRRDPRIRTAVLAAVHLPGKTLTARILNLSMSGALIGFNRDQIPPEMAIGVLFRLDAYDEHGGISLSAKGEIIRLIGVGKPTNAGARFIDVDDEVRSHIEEIILSEILLQNMSADENSTQA